MDLESDRPRHVVAIVGGATAGSAAAQILADSGVIVLVVEQNERPYGKIEDGLPRWHLQQRRNEYEKIDARLQRPGVHYLPRTRLGRDVDFDTLTRDWGLSAILLANGAWKDRPLPVESATSFLGRGLVYQNSLIYWFNHKGEQAYAGQRYFVPDGTLVVGGGLASIDVIKVVQFEIYERALRARGIEVSMHDLEHKGIGEICSQHGVEAAALGVKNGILVYRRRGEDMPLAQIPPGAGPEKIAKTQEVRARILHKAQEKYLFEFRPNLAPVAPLIEGDQLVGLRFLRTQVENGTVKSIPGSEVEIRSELTISSIGSVPEPIPGIDMKGEYYVFKDEATGQYAGRSNVFGAGNVVTGKGNIRVSLEHGQAVAHALVEQYLGVAEREPGAPTQLLQDARGSQMGQELLARLSQQPPLPGPKVAEILERVRTLQQKIGYDTDYATWIRRVTPPDLE